MDEVPEAFEKTPPILMIREDLELISEDPCDTPPSTSGTDKETTNIVNLDLITGSCSSIRNRAVEENQRVIETISEPSVDAEDSHVTAKPSTSSSDQLESKRDVEVVIDKLCEDVTKNEEDFIQVTTPENVTIRVYKRLVDIATHFGFNPFSYIRVEPLLLSKFRSNKSNDSRNSVDSTKPSLNDESKTRKHKEDKTSKFNSKKLKCITATCKVCLSPMDQRTFMPNGETFYCSTECIHNKVKQVRKTLSNYDQIFVTDKRGRLHANYVPNIDSLEAFLLRRPNHEPCVKTIEDEPGPPIYSAADDSRARIRKTFSDQILRRCTFHGIDISEKKAKELSHQVEYDLFEYIKSVKDLRYRNWCRNFMKFLMISGNVFLDKFINGTITTARLVRIPDRLLDSELHKLDEIEPAVEQPAKSEEQFAETTPFFPDSKPKNVPLFPFKRRSTPFNLSATTVIQPAETGKSVIDDILGLEKDTTSKHMSHTYDANCKICQQKAQIELDLLEKFKKTKEKEEKEREKWMKRNEGKEETDKRSRTSSSRFEDATKRRSRNRHSDEDSPDGFAGNDDYLDPLPPGHSPDTGPRLNPIESTRKRRRPRSSPIPLPKIPPYLMDTDSSDPGKFNSSRVRGESWRQPQNRTRMTPDPDLISSMEEELQLIWTGMLDFPGKFQYKCEFSIIKNRLASNNLQRIMPEKMKVQGQVECQHVWKYLENVRNAWTKQIITLLMHPPTDNAEYKMYVDFYKHLERSNRMVVIDVGACIDLKDVYLFALPPNTPLHHGPGLSSIVQQCGNICCVVIRNTGKRFSQRRGLEREKTPRIENPFAATKHPPEEVLKRQHTLNDIPIVEKSPFGSTSDSVSVQSFTRENSLMTEFIPPPPPPDDNMEVSADEDGEIASPEDSMDLLPAPPPAPDLVPTFGPIPTMPIVHTVANPLHLSAELSRAPENIPSPRMAMRGMNPPPLRYQVIRPNGPTSGQLRMLPMRGGPLPPQGRRLPRPRINGPVPGGSLMTRGAISLMRRPMPPPPRTSGGGTPMNYGTAMMRGRIPGPPSQRGGMHTHNRGGPSDRFEHFSDYRPQLNGRMHNGSRFPGFRGN